MKDIPVLKLSASPAPSPEIEDDVANLIERMIEVGIVSEGPTERQKQQFRDALAKFVDERIAAALKPLPPGQYRGTL